MGVPFGLSLSDITKAIKLAHTICDRCFNEENSASVKYRRFLQDIQILGGSLGRLQNVVARYERQYGQQQWHPGAAERDRSERLWPQVTGDFYQTLKECDALLKRHKYLVSGTNTFTNNFRFMASEKTLDNLMAKLSFHIERVEFYTRPSEFDAVVKNGSRIYELERQIEKLQDVLTNGPGQAQSLSATILSEPLKERLESEFRIDGPVWSINNTPWPLKEAFEAFRFHFAAGTVGLVVDSGYGKQPTFSEFLNLIKAIWILESIKESHHFQMTSIDSMWADHMRQYKDDVRGQLHRFESGELEKPPLKELLDLPNHFFSIGGDNEKQTPLISIEEAGPLEEKILERELASDASDSQSSLLIFRENEVDFRFVTSTTGVVSQYDREREINMESDRLVPIYANPLQQVCPRHNLLLFNGRGRKPRELNFLNPRDAKEVQRALTGYRVHHNMNVARWCIDGTDSGRGVVQLWQFKPLKALLGANGADGSDRASSLTSNQTIPASPFTLPRLPFEGASEIAELGAWDSGSADLTGQIFQGQYHNTNVVPNPLKSRSSSFTHETRRMTVFSGTTQRDSFVAPGISSSVGRRPSVMSGVITRSMNSVMSPVRGPRSNGTQLLRPEKPVLVLFTMIKGRYSFIHLILDESIYVNIRSCGCRNPKRHCNKVVLESKNKRFQVRFLSADQEGDQGLDGWDVSTFRYPRGEKFQRTKLRDKIETLELQFNDEDEKNEFLVELTSLENVRTADEHEYGSILRERKMRAHQ